eukprot:Sspe_Gene.27515::Locus_11909_Transcript_1_1_Confidence_1.000_Length_950::g.27515::m.27515
MGSGRNARKVPNIYVSVIGLCLTKLAERQSMTKVDVEEDRKVYNSPHGRPPPVSLEFLLERWTTLACSTPSCLITAAIYLDRIKKKCNQSFNTLNMHRLLIASLVLATKWCDDNPCKFALQKRYAQVAGITLEELNILERKALQDLEWDLYVSTEE